MISRQGIRRQAVLNLIALRALSSSDAAATAKLQRYLLGLALVALLAPAERYLREGCLLVPAEDNTPEAKLVERTGKRSKLDLTAEAALEFAQAAAKDFGVGDAWSAKFNADAVRAAAKADEKKQEAKAKKPKS